MLISHVSSRNGLEMYMGHHFFVSPRSLVLLLFLPRISFSTSPLKHRRPPGPRRSFSPPLFVVLSFADFLVSVSFAQSTSGVISVPKNPSHLVTPRVIIFPHTPKHQPCSPPFASPFLTSPLSHCVHTPPRSWLVAFFPNTPPQHGLILLSI